MNPWVFPIELGHSAGFSPRISHVSEKRRNASLQEEASEDNVHATGALVHQQ